jgi:predicted TIM-barrel enzyme
MSIAGSGNSWILNKNLIDTSDKIVRHINILTGNNCIKNSPCISFRLRKNCGAAFFSVNSFSSDFSFSRAGLKSQYFSDWNA